MDFDGPHRRYNPLTRRVGPRARRIAPSARGRGRSSAAARSSRPRYDPSCYLCPGNERAGGERNPRLRRDLRLRQRLPGAAARAARRRRRRRRPAVAPSRRAGVCRVICFSPRHDLTLAADGAPPRSGRVVDTWAEQSRRSGRRRAIRYVQVFENKGAMMGCCNPHPHGQIWAIEHVPQLPRQEARHAAHATSQRTARVCWATISQRELTRGERIVCENDALGRAGPLLGGLALRDDARRRGAASRDLPALTDAERDALADIMRRLCVRYDNLFQTLVPLLDGLARRSRRRRRPPYWHLHAVSSRRCCARRRCASSWSAMRCPASRSATSRPSRPRRACARCPSSTISTSSPPSSPAPASSKLSRDNAGGILSRRAREWRSFAHYAPSFSIQ